MINCISISLITHDDYIASQNIDCGGNNSTYTAGAMGDYKAIEYLCEYLPDASDSLSDQSLSCSVSEPSSIPDKTEFYYNVWMYGAADDWEDYYPSNSLQR